MDIKELVKHLEGQMSHNDAREPGCRWITDELKKYLEEKDASAFMDEGSLIDDILFKRETSRCEWCDMPIDPKENFVVVIHNFGRFRVCKECLNDYANNQYEKLESKIRQVKG
jgi:uncharacterized protein with PIN domain